MSDMKTFPKNTKRQNLMKILSYSDKPKKWPNFIKWQNCFFMASAVHKWPNFSKLAMKWPIWQPCCRKSQLYFNAMIKMGSRVFIVFSTRKKTFGKTG